jgi:4-nitrophenyl phosphatase
MNKWGKGIKAAAFDLDGTLYFGNKVVEGALELVAFLKERSIHVQYFTNNSGKSRQQIYDKLTALGFELKIDDLSTSAYATAKFVKERGWDPIYGVGSSAFLSEFSSFGLKLTNEHKLVKAVVIGLDVEFSYAKLAEVLAVVKKNKCKIVACNVDANYPVENGNLMPGSGPIVSAIENACEKKVDYIIGKPNTYMLEDLAQEHKLKKHEILVVGDSYASDVRMAHHFGCPSILISGTHKKHKKTLVVRRLKDIQRMLHA